MKAGHLGMDHLPVLGAVKDYIGMTVTKRISRAEFHEVVACVGM